ncbi:MAG TPA: hypothetical protein VFX25_19175, partial [Streptosporangiaceae bacterium]|nr:hypothetical protein [Streptosporangiaceae bacterium]
AAAAAASVLGGADAGLTGSPASDSAGPRAPRLARPAPDDPATRAAGNGGSHRPPGWRLPGLGRRRSDD